MQKIQYIRYREGDYIVARGLNLEISSFGTTYDEADRNFQEAVELYFENSAKDPLIPAVDIQIRECAINV